MPLTRAKRLFAALRLLTALVITCFTSALDGDLVAAAHSFGADGLSPVHGNPQDGKVTDPAYALYTTKEMVRDAQGRHQSHSVDRG